jgi:hypothetical protein
MSTTLGRDTKRNGGKGREGKGSKGSTNHPYIAPSTNIRNELASVKLYVHSSWVCL